MSEHTPRPWIPVIESGLDEFSRTPTGGWVAVTDSKHLLIADCHGSRPLSEREANARLIAAAPELLAEHKTWSTLIGRFVVEALQGNMEPFEAFAHAAALDFPDGAPVWRSAAIAKAGGREQ